MTGSLLLVFILGAFDTWPQADKTYLVISLTKTQCFGECPAYDFELYSDCNATFNGIAFTDKQGSWSAKVSKKQMESITNTFQESDFFSFEDRYYAEFTDLPTTYLYYSDGSLEKKVMDYYGAPQRLKDLENKVEVLIDELEWKKQKTTNN